MTMPLQPLPMGTDAFEASDRLIAARIRAVQEARGRSVFIGLCGAQGSGKTTTAKRLVALLAAEGYPTVALSIDDFYLPHADRIALGETVHPLFVTRGVPGTHDLPLAETTIAALLAAGPRDVVPLPFFDKTRDDRAPLDQWPVHRGPARVVLLEGWCVGARPQPEDALVDPVNALEAKEDPHQFWRAYVNDALTGPYAALFGALDLGVLLRAPSFEQVLAWRTEQEEKLDRTDGALPPMDEAALRRFIAHYERITRWLLIDEPADIVIPLAADRTPLGWRERSAG